MKRGLLCAILAGIWTGGLAFFLLSGHLQPNNRPAIDTTKQVITLPSGWFDLPEPIALRDRTGVIIRGDGTTQVNYTGDKSKAVFELVNCKWVKFEGILEIRGNGAETGILIRGENSSPISSIENTVQGPMHILGVNVGAQVGDGTAKSVSENRFRDVQFSGALAGLRINSGNGQNQYIARCRFEGIKKGYGIDLIRGGVHDHDSIFGYNELDVSVGDPNNVLIFNGTYSEGSGGFIWTKALHSPNPGQLNLIGCHLQGMSPAAGHEWLGPCVIRWCLPGPINVFGGEYSGKILVGGAHNTPANFTGVIFKERNQLVRMNDTGTFLATGCQYRNDNTIFTEPFTKLEFAGKEGVSFTSLSWGPQEGRGFRFGTMRTTNDQWWGDIKWDGGGVFGGGNPGAVYWPPNP
jgi:hypothetical protein